MTVPLLRLRNARPACREPVPAPDPARARLLWPAGSLCACPRRIGCAHATPVRMAKGRRLAHPVLHQQASRHADVAGGGAWDRSPDKGQAMTENKAKKNDVRRRMARTGERYNVARRSIETASGPDSYLIGDEETRHVAENFLAASPWLGNVTRQDIVVGPDA